MARPAQTDSRETRRRILRGARELIASRGIEGTSMRAVGQAAQVSVATVLHHFDSKDGLHAACVDSLYEELAELRDELVRALSLAELPDDLTERHAAVEALVEDAIRRTFRFALARRGSMQILMRTVLDSGELDQERRHGFQMPFFATVSELLGAVIGRDAHTLRLPLQSVIHLIVRYALSAPAERARVAAVAQEQADQVHEDHLVRAARALLLQPA